MKFGMVFARWIVASIIESIIVFFGYITCETIESLQYDPYEDSAKVENNI